MQVLFIACKALPRHSVQHSIFVDCWTGYGPSSMFFVTCCPDALFKNSGRWTLKPDWLRKKVVKLIKWRWGTEEERTRNGYIGVCICAFCFVHRSHCVVTVSWLLQLDDWSKRHRYPRIMAWEHIFRWSSPICPEYRSTFCSTFWAPFVLFSRCIASGLFNTFQGSHQPQTLKWHVIIWLCVSTINKNRMLNGASGQGLSMNTTVCQSLVVFFSHETRSSTFESQCCGLFFIFFTPHTIVNVPAQT